MIYSWIGELNKNISSVFTYFLFSCGHRFHICLPLCQSKMGSIKSRYDEIFNENAVAEFVESAKPRNTKNGDDWAEK